MAITATWTMRPNILETLAAGVAAAGDDKVRHDQYKTEETLNATSTPAVSQGAAFLTTLSGGAATIDLTALVKAGGAALDLTGLKVQGFYLEATAGNAAAITVTTGATNGYDLGGDALFSVKLAATATKGESAMYFWNDTSQDVAAGDKDLDLAGSGTDSIQVAIIAG